MLMVVQVLLLKMAFKLSLKFVNLPYLPDASGQSIIRASTIYSETPLILKSYKSTDMHPRLISINLLNTWPSRLFIGMEKRKRMQVFFHQYCLRFGFKKPLTSQAIDF